ncbi:MAG TPA: GGDEF domain-containing protein [Solirubrobacteraceae bacterium]|nr:GGDEF domain-containing protein [Solirubrobacteraceae bacterium]
MALGGVAGGVGAACQAVAARLASDGRLQPSVWLERGGRLRRVAGPGAEGDRSGHAAPVPDVVRTAFAGGVETVVPDLSGGEAGDGTPGAFRARACLPISWEGRVVGVVDVLLRESVRLVDLDVLRAAVDELAACVAAAPRPVESAAARMLRHVARLSPLDEPDAIARTALTAALDLTGLQTAALVRRNADGRLITLASIGPLAASLRSGAGDALEALAAAADGTVRVLVAATAAHEAAPAAPDPAERRALEAAGAEALLVAGLVAEGDSQGLLLLAGDAGAADGDPDLLEALAVNVAGCLHTAELLRALRERAATDPLTGLGHHATFHEALSASHRRPTTAVVLCDIDGFKRLNDSFGHQHGDGVLRGVAAALSGALRRGDTLFRIGGDEFAALLAVSSTEEAVEAGERLRSAVERAGLGVTVSIGIAVPQPDEPDAAVLARADRALYQVKASGRDGVGLAADEPLGIGPPL